MGGGQIVGKLGAQEGVQDKRAIAPGVRLARSDVAAAGAAVAPFSEHEATRAFDQVDQACVTAAALANTHVEEKHVAGPRLAGRDLRIL